MDDEIRMVDLSPEQSADAMLVYRVLRDQLAILSIAKDGIPQASVICGLLMTMAHILAEFVEPEHHEAMLRAIPADLRMRVQDMLNAKAAVRAAIADAAAHVMPTVGTA